MFTIFLAEIVSPGHGGVCFIFSSWQVVDTCLRKILIDRDVQGAIGYSKQVHLVDSKAVSYRLV